MGIYDDLDEQQQRPPEPSYAPIASTAPEVPVAPKPSIYGDLDAQRKAAAEPKQLDKYQQAAIEDRNKLIKIGAPLNEGYTDRLARGTGMGWIDEIAAGVSVPIEMIKRGVGPTEAYRYGKAFQDLKNEKIDENTAGFWGGATEVLGGLATGAGVLGAGTRAAPVAIPIINKTLPAGVTAYGANVAKAAGLGAFVGAGEAPTVADIPQNALMGGVIGGGIGAAAPAVISTIGAAGRALQLPRLRDPQRIATEQIADVVRASGRSMDDVVQQVRNAHAAGQTEYTIADALGVEGQRKLAAMAKSPGAQRDTITELIDSRTINMPHRVSGEVSHALGAPGTARQAQEALIDRASREAGPLYRQAEHSGPVWNNAIQEILDTPQGKAGIKAGVNIQRMEAAGSGKPFNPREYAITDFDKAGDPILGAVPNTKTLHTLKVGLDRLIESNTDAVTGRVNAEGRALVIMKNRLLENMDALNPDYAAARALYRGPMEIRSAVDTGREIATRGRATDNLQTIRQFPEHVRQGVRIGYADAAVTPLERSGNFPGALREKALKGNTELNELSLYQGPRRPGEPDQLRKYLNREEEMLRTNTAAKGGSPTAENLADMAQGPGASELMGLAGSAASGRPFQFLKTAAEVAARFAKGENEAQRVAITNALLARDPAAAQALADRVNAWELRRRGVDPWGNRPPRYRP